eukprot:1099078-Rhodomonas_salina.1
MQHSRLSPSVSALSVHLSSLPCPALPCPALPCPALLSSLHFSFIQLLSSGMQQAERAASPRCVSCSSPSAPPVPTIAPRFATLLYSFLGLLKPPCSSPAHALDIAQRKRGTVQQGCRASLHAQDLLTRVGLCAECEEIRKDAVSALKQASLYAVISAGTRARVLPKPNAQNLSASVSVAVS